MAGHPTGSRKTVEDLYALPEGIRAELIDGEIQVTPSPEVGHQEVGFRLARLLADHVERLGCGTVFIAPLDVHLPTGDVVQPDILWVSSARLGIVRRWIEGAPDLVVEVLSPGSDERDRGVKRELYARGGVGEYWIVDPGAGTVEVLRLEDRRYRGVGSFEGRGVLTSPSLPGLSIGLERVFAVARGGP